MSQPRSKSSFQLGTPWHVKSLTCVFKNGYQHITAWHPRALSLKKNRCLVLSINRVFLSNFQTLHGPPRVPRLSVTKPGFHIVGVLRLQIRSFSTLLQLRSTSSFCPATHAHSLGAVKLRAWLSAGWGNLPYWNRGPWMVYKTWILNQIHWEFLTSSVIDDDWSN